MPIYEFCCKSCKHVTDFFTTYDLRMDTQKCSECGGDAEYIVSAPLYTGERIVGSKRIIHSERQVTSEKGPNWRDKGTTGKPGGAGKTLYFD